jgi:type II secretory pathway component PulF
VAACDSASLADEFKVRRTSRDTAFVGIQGKASASDLAHITSKLLSLVGRGFTVGKAVEILQKSNTGKDFTIVLVGNPELRLQAQ